LLSESEIVLHCLLNRSYENHLPLCIKYIVHEMNHALACSNNNMMRLATTTRLLNR